MGGAPRGRPIPRVRVGAIDRPTGISIGDYLLFGGEIDVPVLSVGKGRRALALECVSSFERFFDNDEGTRLSESFHQATWPGETGFSNVTGIEQTIYWGVASPAGTVKTGGLGRLLP